MLGGSEMFAMEIHGPDDVELVTVGHVKGRTGPPGLERRASW
jgi:hypothetical protein